MAGWMFGYIATTQVTALIITRIANDASVLAGRARVGYGAGYTPYAYAWQLFQMPYAVIGISVITALLPRMSGHAAASRPERVRADFATGVRLSGVLVVPASLVLAVLGPDLAEAFLAHGSMSVPTARYLGEVFAVLCLGLVPYTVFQLQLRVFYALHDSRTPALIGAVAMAVSVAACYGALAALPPGQVVTGLGAAFGLGNVAAAAVPAAAAALAVTLAAPALLPGGRLGALLAAAVAGSLGLAVYLAAGRVLRIAELTRLLAAASSRHRR